MSKLVEGLKKAIGKEKEVFVPAGFEKEDVLMMQKRFSAVHKAMKEFSEMDKSWGFFESEIDHGDLKKDPVRVYAMKTENRINCGGYRHVAKAVAGDQVYYYVSSDMGFSGKKPKSGMFFTQNSNGQFLRGEYEENDNGFFKSKTPELDISGMGSDRIRDGFVNRGLEKWVDLIPEIADQVISDNNMLDKFGYDKGKNDQDFEM